MNSDTFLVDYRRCPRQFRADECPLLGLNGHAFLHCKCLRLTQREHETFGGRQLWRSGPEIDRSLITSVHFSAVFDLGQRLLSQGTDYS